MSYPVARGTPMIQSLVEWDHSIQWAVAEFSKKVNFNKIKINACIKHSLLFSFILKMVNYRKLDLVNLSSKLI